MITANVYKLVIKPSSSGAYEPPRGRKEPWTNVPILYQITLQNVPYMGFNLLVLMSFEVTTTTTMDSQGPLPAVTIATCLAS